MVTKKKNDPKAPQQIDVEIQYSSESIKFMDYLTVDEGIEFLQGIKNAYPGKTIVFKSVGIAYENGEEYGLYERRLETQEEVDARLKLFAECEAQREANERRQFEELSKRYGSKGP